MQRGLTRLLISQSTSRSGTGLSHNYVRNIFVTVLYPSPVNLELLALSISTGINKVCISLFYRPPNSTSDILLGDFNVNPYNQNHTYLKLVNIFSSFGLTQIVSTYALMGTGP